MDAIERSDRLPAQRSAPTAASAPRLSLPDDVNAATAAAALAEALERVPGAQRYAEMPLSDLASRGPRVARTLWAGIPEHIRGELGSRTIGQLLDERR